MQKKITMILFKTWGNVLLGERTLQIKVMKTKTVFFLFYQFILF